MKVIKRNSSKEDFDQRKIYAAVESAFNSADREYPPLESVVIDVVTYIIGRLDFNIEDSIPVETIHDEVERSLMVCGYHDTAKAYILFRKKREEERENKELLLMPTEAISNYITINKYSRYIPEKKRREVFSEIVDRVKGMHLRRYPQITERIHKAFELVYEKRALPSMRSMQFGGSPVEAKNARIFNCAFSPIDRIEFFSEALYLLLCGVGVGYSVQKHNIEKLPYFCEVDTRKVNHHTIEDSIEGWADAVKALLYGHVGGYYVEFNYSQIRNKGLILKTSGGRAPGHIDLKKSLELIRGILRKVVNRQLTSLEAHDVICITSDAVLAGGIRRSALICLFDIDDQAMMTCKTGEWWVNTPWRARANNSAVGVRNDITFDQFAKLFESVKVSGDPGISFTDNPLVGVNPCHEISLNSFISITYENLTLMRLKLQDQNLNVGDTITGFSFCNLTCANVAKANTYGELEVAVVSAAFIGTLQASYTDFKYLAPASKVLAEREALIGVSLVGMMDNPNLIFSAEVQQKLAKKVVEVNVETAKLLGINPSARSTTVKPHGTDALVLGCVGSGIHDHPSPNYFRRVTANNESPVFKFFRSKNPHMCEKISDTSSIITFCITAKKGSIYSSDQTAIEFINRVLMTTKNWIKYGLNSDTYCKGLTNHVSNTVTVNSDEWEDVKYHIWSNRHALGGIAMTGSNLGAVFKNLPREAVKTQEDIRKWNYLCKNYTSVDYTEMVEEEDNTELVGELACSGGSCEVV